MVMLGRLELWLSWGFDNLVDANPISILFPSKGSLQKKKPEIYWSFTNTGGGEYPPTNIFPVFSWRKNIYSLKMIYMLQNM